VIPLFKKNKKGIGLKDAPAVVIILLVIGVVLGVGQSVLSNFMKTQCDGQTNTRWNATVDQCVNFTGQVESSKLSYALNSTEKARQGVDTMSNFQSTIAIVIVAGIILGIIGAVLVKNFYHG
jgi:H+/Cl- antiporter ClcA